LWWIIKDINRTTETDLIVKTAEAAAGAAVNRLNSVVKPIMTDSRLPKGTGCRDLLERF